MKNKNRYAVYQLRDDSELDKIRGMSYNDLQKAHIYIDPNNYSQMYMCGMRDDDTIISIFKRLKRFMPDGFPGDPIQTSDIIALVIDEFPTAYYVDGNNLVLLSGFFKPEGDNRLICIDNTEYVIADKAGRWVPVSEFVMSGVPFYEMKNADDAHELHILVSFDGQVISEGFRSLSNPDYARAQHHLDLWQKYYENGEYVRNLGDYAGAMVNYSRIDGSRGNQDRDYIEEVRQVQEKQKAERTQKEIERKAKTNNKTLGMSYKDRIKAAHAKIDERDNANEEAMTADNEREEAQVQDESFENKILNHLSKFETNVNRQLTRQQEQISNMERENSHKERSIDDGIDLERK